MRSRQWCKYYVNYAFDIIMTLCQYYNDLVMTLSTLYRHYPHSIDIIKCRKSHQIDLEQLCEIEKQKLALDVHPTTPDHKVANFSKFQQRKKRGSKS